MKSLPLSEVKKRATESGPERHLAFDELARRYRDDPSTWAPDPSDPPTGCPRAPDVLEAEWAHLKWSLRFNEGKDSELARVQEGRLEELERYLDKDPDSLKVKYFNAIGEELSRQR